MNEILNAVWAEKWRPKKVDELIATNEIKNLVQGMIDKKEVGNLLLVGRPGVGKTTIAKMVLDILGYEYIIINASLEGNIDTLRNKIQQFASTVSFSGGRKYVIFDEADYSNASSTQPALRNFIESFAGNCGFIFTANYENRIIEPLRDRLTVKRFNFPRDQYPQLALAFTKRLKHILTNEKVEFDSDTLGQYVIMNMPNWRSIINNIQSYVTENGQVDTGILAAQQKIAVDSLVKPLLKTKSFSEVRKWVSNNLNNDPSQIYTGLAESLPQYLVEQSIGDLIIIIARYQYQAAFVADQQVNLAACLAEIMATCLAK